jgi:hypothetical protein
MYDGPRPLEITKYRMETTSRRIRAYYAQHSFLPKTLYDLKAVAPDHDGSIEDGWGRPIYYVHKPDGTVILRSGLDYHMQPLSIQFVFPPTADQSSGSIPKHIAR